MSNSEGEKVIVNWGIGSLSFGMWILVFLICTTQTKSLSIMEYRWQIFSSLKRNLFGIGLILASYILAKNYPNHKFSSISKKCASGFFIAVH